MTNQRITPSILTTLLVAACQVPTSEAQSFRTHEEACPPGCVCVCEPHETSSGSSDSAGSYSGEATSPSSSSDSSSSESSGEGSSSGGELTEPPIPLSTGVCPDFSPGTNAFCPAGMTCRDVEVRGVAGVSGPLSMFWHGTYNSPDSVLSDPWHPASMIRDTMAADGGIAVYPWGDPAAAARPGQPFPWWVVADCTLAGAECDRPDDFLLADEIVACAVEAGIVDPYRITIGGMSAGGIMSSNLLDRAGWVAGAAVWSGGMGNGEPMTPAGPASAIILHGGAADLYCGTGAGPNPGDCHAFQGPSENLAADMVAAGNWAFLCDHSEGDISQYHHTPAMASTGTAFLQASVWGVAHPTQQDPFPGGLGWMIDNYCYASGDPSPWE